MNKKNIAIIVAVAIVCGIFSFAIANFFFGGEKTYKLTASKVEPISSDFNLPSEKYFNKQALNPTKNITIGDSSNTTPFKTSQ